MHTLYTLLKIGLLLYALYSIIAYYNRRSGNREALKSVQADTPLRELTPEEAAALQPILTANGITCTPGVRVLTGEFVQHGIQFDNNTTRQSTLGGVDVLLPYDAMAFVQEYNKAEVVITKKYAVVIRLNDFAIAEGYARMLLAVRNPSDGADDDMEDINPEAVVAAIAAPAPIDPYAHLRNGEVDVLNERQETPEELAWKRGNLRGKSALLWLAAFLVLWVATWKVTRGMHLYLTGTALITAAAALWLGVRRPAAGTPGTVQRVRGMINKVAMVTARTGTADALFLGNRFAIKFPDDWRVDKDKLLGQVVEMEVCTSDHRVVGMGRGWSLTADLKRFAPVFWGHHLLHAFVAAVALFVVYQNMSSLRIEFDLARQRLTGEIKSYSSAKALQASPPHSGNTIHIHGKGRCELQATSLERNLPTTTCTTVRVDGDALEAPPFTMPEALVALADDSFMPAVNSAGISGMQSPQLPDRGGQGTLSLRSLGASAPQTVNLKRALTMIDQACNTDLRDCTRLKSMILISLGRYVSPGHWENLVAQAKDSEEIGKNAAGMIQFSVRNAVATQMKADWSSVIQNKILDKQRGGFLVHSPQAFENASGSPLFVPDSYHDDWFKLAVWWEDLKQITSPSWVDMEGTVTEQGILQDGTPWVKVTPLPPGIGSWSAVTNMLWLGLALALLTWHSVFFVVRLRQSSQRHRLLGIAMAERPAPGLIF